MFTISIENFEQWRQQARELIKRKIDPSDIAWQNSSQNALLFDDTESFLALPVAVSSISISKEFFDLAFHVACFRSEERWALLYSVAYRLVFEDKLLLRNVTDSQVAKLITMRKRVSRDKHKMKAFVRFKRVGSKNIALSIDKDKDIKDEYFVAWFEPEHLIVEQICVFFTKRFTNMKWSILTPDICAHWDTHALTFSKGITSAPKLEDELETLWLEYYANIFNPARLKLKAMQSEMPKKYWKNLPEAPLIQELTRNSTNKVDTMITRGASSSWSKTEKSRLVKDKQRELRAAVSKNS